MGVLMVTGWADVFINTLVDGLTVTGTFGTFLGAILLDRVDALDWDNVLDVMGTALLTYKWI